VKPQEQPVDPVQKQIAELEKAKLKALFEYTKTVAEIDERLSKLLAEGKE
jgi:TPP-dependent pyruvate/acetoin dehydrogenase alpha subunit